MRRLRRILDSLFPHHLEERPAHRVVRVITCDPEWDLY